MWVRKKVLLFSFERLINSYLEGLTGLSEVTQEGAQRFSGYMSCTLPSLHWFSKAHCCFFFLLLLLSCPWKPLFKQNLTQKHEQIKQKKSSAALLKAGVGGPGYSQGQFIFLTSNSSNMVKLHHSFINSFRK